MVDIQKETRIFKMHLEKDRRRYELSGRNPAYSRADDSYI